jgi:tetratricopeptide (TPR) repeat protein
MRLMVTGEPPDPAGAGTFDEFSARLRLVREWAGNPSYAAIRRRIAAARAARGLPKSEQEPGRTTVYECFQPGRRRLDVELVADIVRVLLGDETRIGQWRQACQVVLSGASLASIVTASGALPGDLSEFTGRDDELDRVVGLADRAGAGALICVITGMPGVGKTQLAVHAGHVLLQRGRFTEIRLFVNLRGFDPDQPPADPAAALDSFLRLLGVPGHQVQRLDLAGRAAKYRELLAGKQALVVLDNAASEDQVRPLLPMSRTCLALVTSRRELNGLKEATQIPLDMFTRDEALDFLGRVVGAGRIETEPEDAARIVELCGRLPYDLAVTAGDVRRRAAWSLADHVKRLESFPRDEAIRPAFAASYESLPAPRQRLFWLLALHPAAGLTPDAAAALADVELTSAHDMLGLLGSEHLLQQKAPGRYEFHDLMRVYATRVAHDEGSGSEHRAALTRLFDYYLCTASLAMDTLYPAEQHRRPRIPPTATITAPVAKPAAARAWLDAERSALVAVATHAAAHGWSAHAMRLAATLFRFLDTGGYYTDAITIHTHALHAARGANDRLAEAHALTSVGSVYMRQGHYELAADHHQRARALCRQIGDRTGEARALGNLGLVSMRQGHYKQAADHHQQAVVLYHEIGDRTGEARALGNLGAACQRLGRDELASAHHHQALALFQQIGDRVGEAEEFDNLGDVAFRQGRYTQALGHYQHAGSLLHQIGDLDGEAVALDHLGLVYQRQGRYQQALHCYQRALALFAEIGDRPRQARALCNLGTICHRQGNYEQAKDHLQQALGLSREIGDLPGEAAALTNLGTIYEAQNRHNQAIGHHQQALGLLRETGDPAGKAQTLNNLGQTLRASGQTEQSRIQHAAALTLADQTGDKYEQARAHNGLAHAYDSTGDPRSAHRHWQQSFTLYAELGVPEADAVGAHLTALNADWPS